MESSTDESFTWEKVSNASDDTSDSSTNDNNKSFVKEKMNGNHSKKDEKKKITNIKNETFTDDESIHNSVYHPSPKKKAIKLENISDNDTKKKKKKKKKDHDNENMDCSIDNDDSILLSSKKQEIKLEASSDIDTKIKKLKKNKDHDSTEYSYNNEESFFKKIVKEEIASSKKLKSKKNKKLSHSSNNSNINSTNEQESDENNDAHNYVEINNLNYKKDNTASTDESFLNMMVKEEINHSLNQKSKKSKMLNDTVNNYSVDSISEIECEEVVNNDIDTYVKEKTKKKKKRSINLDVTDNDNLSTNQSLDCDKSCNNINNSIITQKKKDKEPKILDRLQFEEEIVSDEPNNITSKQHSSQINHFVKTNPILQAITDLGDLSEITQNEEVWILKCPKEVNINDFCDKYLTLDNKSKLKINGETHCGILEDENSKITIMSKEQNQIVVKNVDINGVITFRKKLRKPQCAEYNDMANHQTDFIPLPETKCRHPLFGLHYKDAIKVPKSLSHRLNDLYPATVVKQEKKKKKRSKQDYDDTQSNDNDSVMKDIKYEVLEETSTPTRKKSKKRKHSEDNEETGNKAIRKRKEMDSSEVWDSEKGIEESLFSF